MATYSTNTQRIIRLGSELGRGGEATIYEMSGDDAAKIYHARQCPPEEKLRAMLANPPDDPTRQQSHISIAWMTELLYADNGQVCGYVMPKIKGGIPLHKIYSPRDRRQYVGFTWKYLHHTAQNLASIVAAVHANGYVIGDLNESNIIVQPTTLVTLVDTDSFQVTSPQGHTFRCLMSKPELTAPEIQTQDLTKIVRTPEQDCFALAVLIFLLLMEGSHPFRGSGEPPELEQRIRQGLYPYPLTRPASSNPPRNALPFSALFPEIQQLFDACFVAGHCDPSRRPHAADWFTALNRAEDALVECARNPHHWYVGRQPQCIWCARTRQLQGRDPFPPPVLPPQPPSLTPMPKPLEEWTDPVSGITFVWIPGGTFLMGSDGEGCDNEYPQHRVTLKGFWMGKYEVTQAQWLAIMSVNPSYFRGANHPVEQISWNDAQAFIEKLNDKAGKEVYRLPSEAEWEYACRAGTITSFYFGWRIETYEANYNGNYVYGHTSNSRSVYRGQTTAVGSFRGNAFGLYDMHGNVWEWVADTWHENYTDAPSDGRVWGNLDNEAADRVVRGGSWSTTDPRDLRCAYRSHSRPTDRYYYFGVRVACVR